MLLKKWEDSQYDDKHPGQLGAGGEEDSGVEEG